MLQNGILTLKIKYKKIKHLHGNEKAMVAFQQKTLFEENSGLALSLSRFHGD